MRKCVALCCLLYSILTYAASESAQIQATSTHLQQLENKIVELKEELSAEEKKQQTITVNLEKTTHNLENTQNTLAQLEHELYNTQKAIGDLHRAILPLQHKHLQLQLSLTENIRTLYRLSEARIRLLPENNQQLMQYIKYFIRSNQSLLKELHKAEIHTHTTENKLLLALQKQQLLQKKYSYQQEILQSKRKMHTQDITKTNENIQHIQQTLNNYQQDQAALSSLLHTLTTQSVVQTRHSFAHMQHKLPQPLHILVHKHLVYHQGILMPAPNNTPVYAVYPGKVVFANWLNGYGFLLILDHGWGFMTVYGHNKKLLKSIGDTVAANDSIALVGQSGTFKQSGLYFEIRHQGKPVTPVKWLQE